MIIDGTRLVVTDNSGAREVECIKVKGAYASIGDIITCSVKKAIRGKVSKVSGVQGAAGCSPRMLCLHAPHVASWKVGDVMFMWACCGVG